MFRRHSFCRLLAALILALSVCHAAIVGAAAPLHKVVFVFAGFNERTGYIFVAKDLRFFEEQGLDAQIVQVRNGQVAVSALAASEAQFYSVSATGASLGAMAAGLDLAFIAGIVNKLGWRLRGCAENQRACGSQRKIYRRSEHRWRRVDIHDACS